MLRLTLCAYLIQFVLCGLTFSQDPVKLLATNNNGFVQTLPGGPDNLILYEFVPDYPDPPEDPPMPDPAQFLLVGSLDSGFDEDGNGFEESIGTFTGLEWSTGVPGAGTLIGCVRNDNITEVSNGEFYQIDPDTAETELIGAAPNGRVVSLVPNGSGYVPFPPPLCAALIGGSGNGLCVSFNVQNGFVVEMIVAGPGQGYEVGDVVRIDGEPFQDATFVITEVDGSEFCDLGYDPVNNRMVGVMNNILEDGDFGVNTFWVDTDNDRVPDTNVGPLIDFESFEPLATLIGGFHIDDTGRYYVYDVLNGVALVIENADFPFILAPDGHATIDNIESSELVEGNGIAAVGTTLVVATDDVERFTIVSAAETADLDPENPFPMVQQVIFPQGFSSGMFISQVAIGDMVPAEADFDGVPSFFPDSVIINNGSPGDNAVLEAVVVSDDFRYCIIGAPPTKTTAPIDVSFVFTIPNPAGITTLGLEIESQANVDNLRSRVFVQNIKTGVFEMVESELIDPGSDDTFTVELSANIAEYVDPNNGTMTVNIQTTAEGPTFFFPWQMKYDAVLAVAE